MGCILYELATLRHAFEPGCLANLMLKILRGTYPPVSNKYSLDTRLLIQSLLRKKPEDRPSLNSILRKDFLVKIEAEMYKPLPAKSAQQSKVQKQTKKVQNVYRKTAKGSRRNSE